MSTSTREIYNVAVVGAGLAGLALAVELVRRKVERVVLIDRHRGVEFAGGQPAIATHPHYSRDFNWLSQWTAVASEIAEAELQNLQRLDPSLTIGRGRWTVPANATEAERLRSASAVFNANVPRFMRTEWRSRMDLPNGALYSPGTWIIAPAVLNSLWREEFMALGGEFIDASAQSVVTHSGINAPTAPSQLQSWEVQLAGPICISENVVIAAPQFIEHRGKQFMPIHNNPGASTEILRPDLTLAFGTAAVRNDAYALPRDQHSDYWLSTLDAELAEFASNSTSVRYPGERWSTPDRLPYLGLMIDAAQIETMQPELLKYERRSIPVLNGVYVASGHGSRGLIGSILAAQVIADMIEEKPSMLSTRLQQATSPSRYVRRVCKQ